MLMLAKSEMFRRKMILSISLMMLILKLAHGAHLLGCMKVNLETPYFTTIEATDIKDPQKCIFQCPQTYQYAAIDQDSMCACDSTIQANYSPLDLCNLPCTSSFPEHGCGGNGFISVYEIPKSNLSNFDLIIQKYPDTVSPMKCTLQNPELLQVINFDDDTESFTKLNYTGEFSTDGHFQHYYNIPGEYKIIAEADDNKKTKLIEKKMTVSDVFYESMVTLQCPSVAETSETIYCNLTLGTGSNIEMLVDFGDETKVTLNPPDSVFLNERKIPQVPINPEEYQPDGIVLITKIKDEAYFINYEIYAKVGSKIAFMVMKTECSNDQLFCADDNRCSKICPEECKKIFETSSGQCEDEFKESDSLTTTHTFKDQQETRVSMDDNWEYIRMDFTNTSIKLQPGDAIGFKLISGSIAKKLKISNQSQENDVQLIEGKLVSSESQSYASATILIPTALELSHQYNVPGNYVITYSMNINNQSHAKKTVNDIHVLGVLNGLIIELESETIDPNSIANITFSLKGGSEANFTYFIGELPLDSEYIKDISPERILYKTIAFSTPGQYNITIVAENALRSISNSCIIYVTATEAQCDNFNLEIIYNKPQNEAKSMATVLRVPTSKSLRLASRLDIPEGCAENLKTSRWWNVTRIHPTTGEQVEIEPGINQPTWNYSFLHLNEDFLNASYYYRINCSIEISSGDNNSFNTSSSSDIMYVLGVKSPVISVIIQNSMRSVSRGPSQLVELFIKDLSIDPNDPNNKEFTVQWRCSREEGTVTTDQIHIPNSTVTNDDGGCFGTGDGFISNLDSNWALNTSILYPYQSDEERTYYISGFIENNGRSANSTVELNVHNSEQLIFTLDCGYKERCHLTTYGIYINKNSNLTLISHCVEECEDEDYWEYQWEARSRTNNLQYDLSDHSIGINYHEILIKESFFNTSDMDEIIFLLKVFSPIRKLNGSASMLFKFNKPPFGGECHVEEVSKPPLNQAIFSEFKVTCNHWEDVEDQEYDFRYELYVTTNAFNPLHDADHNSYSNWKVMLYSGRESIIKLFLPCWKLKLYISVQDSMEAVTKIFFNDFELQLPPSNRFTEYIKSSWVSYLKAIGDQYALLQKTIAVASISKCMKRGTVYETGMSPVQFLDHLISTLSEINIDTPRDVEMISGVMATTVDEGNHLSLKSKDNIMKLLKRMNNALEKDKNLSPEQVHEIAINIIQIAGALMTTATTGLWRHKYLPEDITGIEQRDYDTTFNIDEFRTVNNKEDLQKNVLKRTLKAETQIYMKQIDQFLELFKEKLFDFTVANQPPLVLNAPFASMLTYEYTSTEFQTSIQFGDASFDLPEPCDVLAHLNQTCTNSSSLSITGIAWNTVYIPNGPDAKALTSNLSTVTIDLYNREPKKSGLNEGSLKIIHFPQYFNIGLPAVHKGHHLSHQKNSKFNQNNNQSTQFVRPQLKYFEFMSYHAFTVKSGQTFVTLSFTPENASDVYIIYQKYRQKPNLNNYDSMINIQETPENATTSKQTIIYNHEVINSRVGRFFVGVAKLSEEYNNITFNDSNITKDMLQQNFSTGYQLDITVSGCYYYDKFTSNWKSNGCYMDSMTQNTVFCKCNHLTTFGAGIFVKPNTINFSYVFANANFTDNLTIYCTIIITLIIYLLLILWAQWKDRKDIRKLGAIPLLDNKPKDKYIYEILVFTGHNQNASTDSKVSFVVTGDQDETEVREFNNLENRKTLQKDNIDAFVMVVPRPLGQLQCLRIWHDNTGTGLSASWFLDYIVIRDVQTGEKFQFIANKWFATERENGKIDRSIPVATKDELVEFSHLFHATSHKMISDGHLWFSIFLRPPRSRYTRCQRVSSCMALLYLFMITNAMWYGTVPEKSANHSFKMGPLNLGLEQLSIAVASNLIVFPPSALLVFLFRSSRPRKLRPSRIDSALKNTGHASEQNPKTSHQRYKRTKSFALPWFFRYIAWILCFLCIGASIFFLWAYGIQFGNSKTKKWITSLIISFFTSVFISQPIQVFLTAMILSSICKKVEVDEDDADEDEKDPHLSHDEEWYKNTNPKSTFKRLPVTEVEDKVKQNQLKEVKMWQILTEILGYTMYLSVLTVIAHGVRDPNSFTLHRSLKNAFVHEGKDYDFNKITQLRDFQEWALQVLIPEIRPTKHYNGKATLGWMGYLKDGNNRLLGPVTMRQVRMFSDHLPEITCFRGLNYACAGPSKEIFVEETKNFFPKWTSTANHTETTETEDVALFKPFRYSSGNEYKFVEVMGNFAVYPKGGYVYEMKNQNLAQELIVLLNNEKWVDQKTTALFVEFSTYNPAVDLFAVVKLSLEVTTGGAFSPYIRINTIRLLSIGDGLGNFYMVSNIIYVLFLLYYTVRQLQLLCSEGKAYFRKTWNRMELLVIFLSIASIVLYIMKTILLTQVLKETREGKFWKPVQLPRAQMIDEIFCYSVSFSMFFAIIKFTKLLRFNKRVFILATTIQQCLKNLVGFAIFFIVMFSAFVWLFAIKFSTTSSCRSLIRSAGTLFRIMLNKFLFDEFEDSDPYYGPLLFFGFSFSFSLFTINIFLSIIIGSFEMVRHDLRSTTDFNLTGYIYNRLCGLFGFKTNNVTHNKNQSKRKISNDDNENATSQLPTKVDQLLNYINNSYFEGRLDLTNKSLMGLHQHSNHTINSNSDSDEPTIYHSN